MKIAAPALLRAPLGRLAEAAALHTSASGVALLFGLARRLDPRFRRALAPIRATYELRAGEAARQIVLDRGRVSTRAPGRAPPDYQILFVDLPGSLARLAHEPNDVLRLQLENMIQPAGNLHYLFQLGYLLGLIKRYLDDHLPRARRS